MNPSPPLPPGVAGLFLHQESDGTEAWGWWRGDGSWDDLRAAGLQGGLEAAATWLADGGAAAGSADPPPPPRHDPPRPVLPGRPPQLLCVGRNFAAHAAELGNEVPEELLWFARPVRSLTDPGGTAWPPHHPPSPLALEGELAVLVGRRLRGDLDPEELGDAVVACAPALDLTARAVQRADQARGWPWTRSKGVAGSCTFGPLWADARGLDLAALRLVSRVDGEVWQDAGLDTMLRSPERVLAEIARWTPLGPGDVVLLGTPAGAGELPPGARVETEIAPLGTTVLRVADQGGKTADR